MGDPIGVGVEKVLSSKWVGISSKVGVGGKTWKCVLFRVETATKPIEIKHVLRWKN